MNTDDQADDLVLTRLNRVAGMVKVDCGLNLAQSELRCRAQSNYDDHRIINHDHVAIDRRSILMPS